jgi:predicted nucleic acid-binding Zn ribbon protein
MTTPDCPHRSTSPVDDRAVCDTCGEVLARDEARRRRQLEHVAEVRRSLRKDGDR